MLLELFDKVVCDVVHLPLVSVGSVVAGRCKGKGEEYNRPNDKSVVCFIHNSLMFIVLLLPDKGGDVERADDEGERRNLRDSYLKVVVFLSVNTASYPMCAFTLWVGVATQDLSVCAYRSPFVLYTDVEDLTKRNG